MHAFMLNISACTHKYLYPNYKTLNFVLFFNLIQQQNIYCVCLLVRYNHFYALQQRHRFNIILFNSLGFNIVVVAFSNLLCRNQTKRFCCVFCMCVCVLYIHLITSSEIMFVRIRVYMGFVAFCRTHNALIMCCLEDRF